uniref:NADH dehydrogenase subunit 2 n=1 Tax=Semirhynchia dumbrodiana TaxID=3056118 RepID=UPI0030039FCF|nr:NADH dehydrogenase subunit 2 [Semirhynchia dumbrodiana]
MFKNINTIIFLTTLITGTLISISSNSWIGAWMGLEINLMSFIPLVSENKNLTASESVLKYFLSQAIASSVLLFSILLLFNKNYSSTMEIILNSSLLLKMGAAPFHFWFPEVMEGLDWLTGFILMTWQKIAPFILISYCLNFKFVYLAIMMSIILGSIGGLNQTNLRSLMAYSSINHIGWMLSSLLISINYWMIYFLIYVMISLSIVIIFFNLNIFYFSQLFSSFNNNPINKFFLFCNFLSLGGLPPFTGFLPKWLIIQSLSCTHTFTAIIMVTVTLLTLFFYVRISYSAFTIYSSNISWNKNESLLIDSYSLSMNFLSLFLLISTIFVYSIL